MKIYIQKNGNCNILESLNLMRNLGLEINNEPHPNYKGAYIADYQCKISSLIANIFGLRNEVPSKKLIKFISLMEKKGLVKEEIFTHHGWKEKTDLDCFVFEFEIDKMEYAKYLGKPFGYPKFSYGIKLPFLEARFVPNSNECYYEDFGNEFNGGSTLHPSEEWESEKMRDAIGTKCITEYRSPGTIDGWGSGFKGGFYVIEEK